MSERYNPRQVAEETMSKLKDFQRATVERVIELYKKGSDRVLVADEVGLGKTVVARGVIARFAELREQEGGDLVKVAYICSNQNIASQNVQKLRVSSRVTADLDTSETRLSMQHLRIAEQENDPKVRDGYVQIIPLTPETSFSMTSRLGLRRERALIYVILELMLADKGSWFKTKLRRRLYVSRKGGKREREDEGWNKDIVGFRNRVKACEKTSAGRYPSALIDCLKARGALEIAERFVTGDAAGIDCIHELRRMFAEESAAMLRPDLVIMDEFQRFRFLINAEEGSETSILAERFLKAGQGGDGNRVRVLLLSATPYKLYSTSDEIAESGQDDAYREFLQLIDFLFEGRQADVRDVWQNYTRVLRERSVSDGVVLEYARRAETALAEGICRTERIAVMADGDFISDENVRRAVEVAAGDVASYVEFSRMLDETGVGGHLPVDYVKSCPYLMSYLRGYRIKEKIESAFRGASKKLVAHAKGRHLWIRKVDIDNYRELPKVNARLEALKTYAFEGNAALYMWVPPTLPYYPMEGAYRNAQQYSKVLVFSAWEMVPRMISTLLSYEAERRTLAHRLKDTYGKKHHQRLRESIDGKMTAAYEALVEPQELAWLVGLWNPIESINAGLDLAGVERHVREGVRAKFGRQDADAEQIWVDKALGSPAVCIARCIGMDDGGAQAKALAKSFYDRFNSEMGTAIVERTYERRRDDDAHWRDILRYCKDGCFQSMFDEYYAVVRDEVSFLAGADQTAEIVKRMMDALELRMANYDVDTFNALYERVYPQGHDNLQVSMRTHFAVGFAKGKDEQGDGVDRKAALRKSFNSPLRPFVLASTSIGQEGLDFHPYCRRIFHWNLPSNPIDLEQREGRINRYKCLAVRENAALLYGKQTFINDVWQEVYAAAEKGERTGNRPELIPFWCFGEHQHVKIERIVPKYPCSRDEAAYDRLIRILSVYRLSLGQPRQEELLEHVLKQCPEARMKELKKYFLNLSPFMRGREEAAQGGGGRAAEEQTPREVAKNNADGVVLVG